MTNEQNVTVPTKQTSVGIPMLIGAIIGFMLAALFIGSVNNPKPDWERLWMVRPLIIVPMAGAIGGLFFYFMMYLVTEGIMNKVVAYLLSFVALVIGLWLGLVLGFDRILWN